MNPPHLLAVGAVWDDALDVGAWIAERLGPFGAQVGHAVPLGYAAYAIVPIPVDDEAEEADFEPLTVLDALLDVLAPFTREQPVHSGMWEGWPLWYAPGADPRTAPGMGAGVFWSKDGPQPSEEERARALAEAREEMAAMRVQHPDAAPLELPNRRYYLWSGPLRSALAFRDLFDDPPSLIWPEDRSWFVGAPIYTNEMALGGSHALVDAVCADQRLDAHRATTDDELDIDD